MHVNGPRRAGRLADELRRVVAAFACDADETTVTVSAGDRDDGDGCCGAPGICSRSGCERRAEFAEYQQWWEQLSDEEPAADLAAQAAYAAQSAREPF